MSTSFEDLIGRGATGSKPAAGVPGRLYYDTTLGQWERDTGVAWEVCEPIPGSGDAGDITYTPAVAADWDSDTDPGDVDNALDQLAERVDDLEGAGGGGDSTHTAAYASRPAASNAGDLFLPSDGFVIERDTGAAWVPWGPLFPMTPPVDGDFAWVNQGAASVDSTYGGVYLLDPAAANNHARMRVKAAPGTPYTITVWLRPHIHSVNYNFCGLVWRNSSDGKLCTFQYGNNGGIVLEVAIWSDANTVNASYTQVSIGPQNTIALRVADDGTNRICSWSMDGQHWHVVHTVGRTDYLTPDQVGFFANSVNTTWPAGVTLLSWNEG